MLAEKFFLVLETLISRTNPYKDRHMEFALQQAPIKLQRKRGTRSGRGPFSLGGLLRLDRETDGHFS